jgi:hypothetical protein
VGNDKPSNPWTAGIGSVFSQEFYRIAASRLKPGGIMVQWFHVYEMHDGIVELVLRTFTSIFPMLKSGIPATGTSCCWGRFSRGRVARKFLPGTSRFPACAPTSPSLE